MDYLSNYLMEKKAESSQVKPSRKDILQKLAADSAASGGVDRNDLVAGTGVGLLSALAGYLFSGSWKGALGGGILGALLGVVGQRLGWDGGLIKQMNAKYAPTIDSAVSKVKGWVGLGDKNEPAATSTTGTNPQGKGAVGPEANPAEIPPAQPNLGENMPPPAPAKMSNKTPAGRPLNNGPATATANKGPQVPADTGSTFLNNQQAAAGETPQIAIPDTSNMPEPKPNISMAPPQAPKVGSEAVQNKVVEPQPKAKKTMPNTLGAGDNATDVGLPLEKSGALTDYLNRRGRYKPSCTFIR